MFKPLFDGAGISVCGAYCAVMEFKRMCRLPFTAIAMLLQLQLLCPPDNKLPWSVYVWKKVFPEAKFQVYQAEILLSLQSTTQYW